MALLAINTHTNTATMIKIVAGKYCILNLIVCIRCLPDCSLGKKAKWMSYNAPLVFIGKELRKIEYFFS
jgi:hypothetical protein